MPPECHPSAIEPPPIGLQAASSYLLSYGVLVALFMFIFALAGRQLFGGKHSLLTLHRPALSFTAPLALNHGPSLSFTGKLPPSYTATFARYDTLGQALGASLQVATGSGWAQAMYVHMGQRAFPLHSNFHS